ncbi:MAG: AcrR family transcriptional regulator [Halieaceae bacterium]|jgi:AcrR family transcriptional regulator
MSIKGSKARLPRSERRQQLLNVARDVFAEHGFDATALEQIAEQAGVSRPILYSHFGDKEGLFEAVVDREIVRLTAVVSQSLALPGEPEELLERALRVFFTDMNENRAGHRVLTHDVPLGQSNSGLAEMLANLGAEITSVIMKVRATNDVGPTSAPIFASALLGACFQIGSWWRENPDVSVDDVVSHTVSLFWGGFYGVRQNLAKSQ